ncbi:MAG TPA: gamma-glutamyltransferase, partial [Candidatus Krumholzibacteria bacterium]|nr:gamma-glutamyltransferase [Candidatus Krumholzibacteria bacterium]
MRPFIQAAALCALLAAAPAARGADRVTGRPFATRSEVIAPHAMACTSQPLATQAALEILRQGGSAVDAAIAANAVLGLMEPTGSGIGGDLFAMVWDPGEGELVGYNGSGRSPRGLTLAEFEKRGLTSIPAYGVLPVSVPGCVDGWFALHARYGKLTMAEVLAPAIRYAREGFPVSEVIAYYWQLGVKPRAGQPHFLETFTRDGRAPAKGEMWTNEPLARTYETLAREGRTAFYEGSLARTIARTVQEAGGFLSLEDLALHHGQWVAPVGADYRGVTVWELPPNGQGIAALEILNILEGYDLAAWGFGSPEHVHAFVEAKKLAFADRAKFYADPDFAAAPVAWLVSKEYAAERRALIDPDRAARSVEAGNPALRAGDTIYLTVADGDRMMVSLIQSNYRGL